MCTDLNFIQRTVIFARAMVRTLFNRAGNTFVGLIHNRHLKIYFVVADCNSMNGMERIYTSQCVLIIFRLKQYIGCCLTGRLYKPYRP